MKKAFEKNETLFTILLIVIYVIANSYIMQNFGTTDYRSVIINTLISVLLICLMAALGRIEYYGIRGVDSFKKYLFFTPLLAIMSVNLWGGINMRNTAGEIIFHILTMINVGFIEEIIFRGFLFKMMEKSNLRSAMIVSALTFGIGHIVNLLNGSDIPTTLMQICYAVALGYLFVTIFHKSRSLLPCIITHMAINSLSIFNNADSIIASYVVTAFLVAVSVAYVVYINRVVKDKM